MFDFQLWEALETYLKWFEYWEEQLPLTAILVLIQQREFLIMVAVLSTCFAFQMAGNFLARITNMLRFYRAFMRSQHLLPPQC
jgi:hypothetical protein